MTAPLPAGVTAVIWVAELTVKLAAAVAPNFTAVAPVKLVPVMTTLRAAGSRARRRREATDGRRRDVGERGRVGAGAARPGDATVTVPLPAGATAVIWVSELTTYASPRYRRR